MSRPPPKFHRETLFQSPDMYLLEFNKRQALFVRMTRETYHRSIFMDRQRIVPADPAGSGVNIDQLLESPDTAPVQHPVHFIFHLAHGGSTLLARALDSPGYSLVIREPFPLRQLAVERLGTHPMQFNEGHWLRRLQLVAGLLGRRYQESEPVLVKANVPVNFILPEVLSLHEYSSGIMLYTGLPQYLASLLKTPDHQRWVINVIRQLAGGVKQVPALSSIMVDKLSPPRAAACLWLAQMYNYVRALELNSGLRTLESDLFFDQPGAVLQAASGFMGLDFPAGDIEGIVASKLFTTHSKQPGTAYDSAARKADLEQVVTRNQADISEGLRWAEDYLPELGLPDEMPRPLLA